MNDRKKAMKAYLGDPQLKERFIEEIAKHGMADEIARGAYETEKGGEAVFCAVGCSLDSMNRILARSEPELGIPEVLALLEYRIFEGLPDAEMRSWPRRFAEAIDVGADLSKVWPKFVIWLLVDPKEGAIRFAGDRNSVAEAIRKAASIYQAMEDGSPMEQDRILKIRNECRIAASCAAHAVVDAASYASYAASYASYAAAGASYAASYAASDAAAAASSYASAYSASYAAAARKTFYVRMSEKLVELLKEAK